MRGLRVLFVASEPAGAATYRYRNENLAVALNHSGHRAEVVYVGQSRVRVDHDIVVLHRISDVPEGLAFARAARACGAALVYSTDDLVFDAEAFPEAGDPWTRIRAFAPRHAAMLAEADAVLVSTDFLNGEVLRVFGSSKPVFTIRNFLSDELLLLSTKAHKRTPDESVTICYLAGSATHQEDWNLVAPVLAELLTTLKELHLHVVGPVALDGSLSGAKVVQQPFVPWRQLPAILAKADINLAPLNPRHRFVQGKSEIKFLEAAAANVPTVATRTIGMAEAAPYDAIAYCDSQQEWQETLSRLCVDAEARQSLADAGHRYVLEQGAIAANAAQVTSTFMQIEALARKRTSERAPAGGTLVNTPFAPPKYLLKALQRRLGV